MNYVLQLKSDFKYLISDPLRGILFVVLILWYGSAWIDIIHFPYIPLKNNLLIGTEKVGKYSPAFDSTIPQIFPIGYDSQYFWALSLDPSLQDTLIMHNMGKSAAYRSQRILLPFLTWCIIKDPAHILYGLWFWSLVGIALGLWGLNRLCRHYSIHPIGPMLFFLFNPGMVIAAVHPMSDALASGLIVLALSYWIPGQRVISTLIFSLACLTREFSVFIIGLLVIYSFLINRVKIIQCIFPLGLSVIPLLIWQAYIHAQLGDNLVVLTNNYDFPFVGTLKSWTSYTTHRVGIDDLLSAVFIHLTCFIVIVKWFRHWKQQLFYLVLMSALFMSICGKNIMEDNFGSCRIAILYAVLLSLVLFFKENDQRNLSGSH